MKRMKSGLCGMVAGAAWTAAILGAMFIGYSWIAPLYGSIAGVMTCAMVYYGYYGRNERTEDTDIPYYDKETRIDNCTVQILENTETGEVSIGWWRNDEGSERSWQMGDNKEGDPETNERD